MKFSPNDTVNTDYGIRGSHDSVISLKKTVFISGQLLRKNDEMVHYSLLNIRMILESIL